MRQGTTSAARMSVKQRAVHYHITNNNVNRRPLYPRTTCTYVRDADIQDTANYFAGILPRLRACSGAFGRAEQEGFLTSCRCLHTPVGVGVEVDGLVDGVAPALVLDPVRRQEEGVEEEGGEREVAGDGVVEHGSLERHSEGRPDLAVAGYRNQDDREVGGAHQPHEDTNHSQPVLVGQRGRVHEEGIQNAIVGRDAEWNVKRGTK